MGHSAHRQEHGQESSVEGVEEGGQGEDSEGSRAQGYLRGQTCCGQHAAQNGVRCNRAHCSHCTNRPQASHLQPDDAQTLDTTLIYLCMPYRKYKTAITNTRQQSLEPLLVLLN